LKRIWLCESFVPTALIVLFLGSNNAALADQPGAAKPATADTSSFPDEPKSLPQGNFFSSVKQSLRLDPDNDLVRGHFDLGTAPNQHRYYCLFDSKNGRKEPNGVLGEPISRKDGTTGVKSDSVSLFACDDAEKQGMLVTSGYLLRTRSGALVAAAAASVTPQGSPPARFAPLPQGAVPSIATTPAIAQPPPAAPPPAAPPPPQPAEVSADRIDVAGIKLGMSLDEVRAGLKLKQLRVYHESSETLSFVDPVKNSVQPLPNGRFVNVITASNPPAAGETSDTDAESYEIMFTPLPGKERAMAIVHSVGYAAANAVREVTLENGLIKKYGGFNLSQDLPESPTWRYQSGGSVQVGDSCNGRGQFGGLGKLTTSNMHGNIALKRTPDDFQSQIDHCGQAIVTEDHVTANGGALRADRLVSRFTVSAFSPVIALEGANSAARLIHTAGGSLKGATGTAKASATPNL
jgi:hypothetical protein